MSKYGVFSGPSFPLFGPEKTPYSSDKNANIVTSGLRHDFIIVAGWFYENYMVLNADKCRFFTVGFSEAFPDFSFNAYVSTILQLKMLPRKVFL